LINLDFLTASVMVSVLGRVQ